MEDAKKTKRKIPSSPIKAPQGNVKGIGKMGQYTGGLTPLVVAPKSGLPERRVAPTALRGYAIDKQPSRGRRG